jgi:hypothetical protein
MSAAVEDGACEGARGAEVEPETRITEEGGGVVGSEQGDAAAQGNENEASQRRRLIQKALALIEKRIDGEQMNASLSDLIRLVELAESSRKEEKKPDEMRVYWAEDEE